jgi:hypothetical protein
MQCLKNCYAINGGYKAPNKITLEKKGYFRYWIKQGNTLRFEIGWHHGQNKPYTENFKLPLSGAMQYHDNIVSAWKYIKNTLNR